MPHPFEWPEVKTKETRCSHFTVVLSPPGAEIGAIRRSVHKAIGGFDGIIPVRDDLDY